MTAQSCDAGARVRQGVVLRLDDNYGEGDGEDGGNDGRGPLLGALRVGVVAAVRRRRSRRAVAAPADARGPVPD